MSKFDTAPNTAQDQEPIYNPDDLPILRAALSLPCAMMVEQGMKKEIGRAMAVLHEAAFFTGENTEQLKEVLLRVFQYPAFLDDPDKDDYFEFALHAARTQEGFEHFDAMTTVFATMFGGAPGNDHAAEELLKASKTDLFNQDMFNRLVSEIGWEAIVYALSWAYDERGIDPWEVELELAYDDLLDEYGIGVPEDEDDVAALDCFSSFLQNGTMFDFICLT